jgi:hypothetical protein
MGGCDLEVCPDHLQALLLEREDDQAQGREGSVMAGVYSRLGMETL